MKPEIAELYKIKEEDLESILEMMIGSFKNYPKLAAAFPDWEDRQTAIEMTLRYYGAFDFAYGNVYSLDEGLNEALMIMFSEEQDFSEERFRAAGSYSEKFLQAAERLGEDKVRKWWAFFDELDRKEAELELPERFLYADFLCVREGMQGENRGSRIIGAACDYADRIGLPIMLFTNGEEDVRFYRKNGFKIIAVTTSEEFGFENTYVLYEPKKTCGGETACSRGKADER